MKKVILLLSCFAAVFVYILPARGVNRDNLSLEDMKGASLEDITGIITLHQHELLVTRKYNSFLNLLKSHRQNQGMKASLIKVIVQLNWFASEEHKHLVDRHTTFIVEHISEFLPPSEARKFLEHLHRLISERTLQIAISQKSYRTAYESIDKDAADKLACAKYFLAH